MVGLVPTIHRPAISERALLRAGKLAEGLGRSWRDGSSGQARG
jgi:hypothetical protein